MDFLYHLYPNISVNGEWSTWDEWSPCDIETTKKYRFRACKDPHPAHGGEYCRGTHYDEVDCQGIKAPQNDEYDCSV